MRPRKPEPEEVFSERVVYMVGRLYGLGYSPADIATQMSLPRETVARWIETLRRHGMPKAESRLRRRSESFVAVAKRLAKEREEANKTPPG